jgi:hypothetical protein
MRERDHRTVPRVEWLWFVVALSSCTLDFTLPSANTRRFPTFDEPPPRPRALLGFSQDNLGTPALFADRFRGERSERSALGDFDRDGDLDLLVSPIAGLGEPADQVVLRNDLVETGAFGFTDVSSGVFGAIPAGACATGSLTSLVYAPPFLVGSAYNDCGVVFREGGPLRFDALSDDQVGAQLTGSLVAISASTLDGLDLFLGDYDGTAKLLLWNGDGWSDASSFPENADTTGAAGWADFDGDSRLDLVTLSESGGEAHLFRAVQGGFESTRTTAMFETLAFGEGWLALGDFDNDARIDVAQIGPPTKGAATFRVLFNDGDFRFTAIDPLEMQVGADGIAQTAFAAHDIDNDGDLDGVAMDYDRILVMRSGGDRTFSLETFFAGLVNDLHWVNAGDVDLDGDVDLFACWGATGGVAECALELNAVNGTDFLELFLIGGDDNESALGARVVVFPEGRAGDFSARPLMERQHHLASYQPGSPMVHFGLPPGDRFDVWIRWPGIAAPTILSSVPRGARLRVEHP